MKTSGKCQPQRERLNQFVDLARVYRGWTRGELSKALGRDPSKIVPESGNPKLDLLVGLADALDWQIGDVAESVWNEHPQDQDDYNGLTYAELRPLTVKAFHEGRTADMLKISSQMLSIAETPEERARASSAAALAWDGVGRYNRALSCLQEALMERHIPEELMIGLQNNLANAHYSLWHLLEAKAVSQDVIRRREATEPKGLVELSQLAFAHYVAGNTARRMIEADCPDLPLRAAEARMHLRRAIELYTDALAIEHNPNWAGVVNTCHGGLIEVEAADGHLDPRAAVEQISNGLDEAIDPSKMPVGDMLETWGWWAIFGCNIALRGLEDQDLHHHMAIFTNKAIEIADHLGNWAMRERAFTMENFRRRRVVEATGFKPDWTLDEEDVRVIAGTMGRFPGFRETGWHILETARIFDGC